MKASSVWPPAAANNHPNPWSVLLCLYLEEFFWKAGCIVTGLFSSKLAPLSRKLLAAPTSALQHLCNTCQKLSSECKDEQQLPRPCHDCISHGMRLRASKDVSYGGADDLRKSAVAVRGCPSLPADCDTLQEPSPAQVSER
jgi:hypothetical protein